MFEVLAGYTYRVRLGILRKVCTNITRLHPFGLTGASSDSHYRL